MEIKTNLHFHAKEDPIDKVEYGVKTALKKAAELGFGALALTFHRTFNDGAEFKDEADKNGVLVIPGIEANIENKDVVILNCDKNAEKIKTFAELREYKKNRPDILIIAPHPYVTSTKSLMGKLKQNIDLFDAIEMTVYSNNIFNFNKKARRTALEYKKPFIATSDTHILSYLNKSYAIINSEEKTVASIIKSVKKNNFKNKNTPLPLREMFEFKIFWLKKTFLNIFKNI
jgi:predicted metal-dependent phosphoesterase TrpH